MTKDETKRILTVISATYPTFKVADPVSTLEAWHWALEEYSYGDISKALKVFIKTDGSNFAPSASKLISLVDVEEEHIIPTEIEAWGMVRTVCQGLDWDNPKASFDKLPEIIQRTVHSPGTLKEWAQTDNDTFETVISSNFMRTYKGVIKQYMDEKRMPEEVKQRIGKLRQQMLGTNHRQLRIGESE